ncbi:MAG: LicD family protein [Clostridia bacterium]|nr:LicD family protein [Clostridia bacterium]
MKQEILEKLWQHELKILDEIDRICKKHNITYFIMWGTLIGAVRHKGFIPWDDDIDINMPMKDYKKFLKVAPKELSDEFFLQTSKTDKYHPAYFAKVRLNNTAFYSKEDTNIKKHHGIFVDIIPLYDYKRYPSIFSKIKMKIGERLTLAVACKRENKNAGNRFLKMLPDGILYRLRDIFRNSHGDMFYSWGFYFEREDFLPAIELEFCGKMYSAPKNYDNVLKITYGDYMQLPPEDKRVAHNPGRISFDLSKPDEELN